MFANSLLYNFSTMLLTQIFIFKFIAVAFAFEKFIIEIKLNKMPRPGVINLIINSQNFKYLDE